MERSSPRGEGQGSLNARWSAPRRARVVAFDQLVRSKSTQRVEPRHAEHWNHRLKFQCSTIEIAESPQTLSTRAAKRRHHLSTARFRVKTVRRRRGFPSSGLRKPLAPLRPTGSVMRDAGIARGASPDMIWRRRGIRGSMRTRQVQRWAQRHVRVLSVVWLTTTGAFTVIALALLLVHNSTLAPANAGDRPGYRPEAAPALEPGSRRTTPESAVPTPTPVVVPPSAQPTDGFAGEFAGDEPSAADEPGADAPPSAEQIPTGPETVSDEDPQPRSTAPQQPPEQEAEEAEWEPVLPTGEGILGV